jgi:hypothetical protein
VVFILCDFTPKKTTTLDGRLPFNAATTEAAIPIPPLSNAALLADCFKVSFVFALFSQFILFFSQGIRDVLDMRERFLASELADAQQSGGGPVRLVCDNSTAISAIVQLGEGIFLFMYSSISLFVISSKLIYSYSQRK